MKCGLRNENVIGFASLIVEKRVDTVEDAGSFACAADVCTESEDAAREALPVRVVRVPLELGLELLEQLRGADDARLQAAQLPAPPPILGCH